MKITTTFFCIFWLAVSSVVAENPSIIITDQGYFLLVLKDGSPEIQTPFKVIDTRTGDTPDEPTPHPPGEPKVSPIPALTKEAREVATSIKDTDMAQALALVYRQIRDIAEADGLTAQQGANAIGRATDDVLGDRGEAWKPFRDFASNKFAEELAKGNMNFSNFTLAIAMGLELAADGSEALNFSRLIEVVNTTNLAIEGSK